jgi:SLOG cluster2
MTYREALSRHTVAISISESADMAALGLSEQHLRDAMTEVARHLLALGAQVVYGGDLRANGFTELLFELVARHRRDADEGDERASVLNYLAWPVHVQMAMSELEQVSNDLKGVARLVLLNQHGQTLTMAERAGVPGHQPTDEEWVQGLTAMREAVLANTHARIVLGGRVDRYRGAMPGIAQEALLALDAHQPLYAVGGFGGCARDIVETLGIVSRWTQAEADRAWTGRTLFGAFSSGDLNNGLTEEENRIVAQTPHIDQAVALILRGLLRSGQVDGLPDA